MSKIKIRDIQPIGSNLFDDSESFIDQLQDHELEQTMGGSLFLPSLILITVPAPQSGLPLPSLNPGPLPFTHVIL